jgi:hypothetical protein
MNERLEQGQYYPPVSLLPTRQSGFGELHVLETRPHI